jgi:hypothetical protein
MLWQSKPMETVCSTGFSVRLPRLADAERKLGRLEAGLHRPAVVVAGARPARAGPQEA